MRGIVGGLVLLSLALSVMAEDGPPTLLWQREYFPDRIAAFNCVIETYDGGFAVAAAVPGTNGNNRPVIRFDNEGNMLWYAGNAYYSQSAFWVEELPDHSLISTGGVMLASGEDVDLYLFRIDPSGQLVWAKTYAGSSEDDRGLCCTLLPDGGFAVCGYTDDYDPWLLRTDSQGDTLWTRVFETGWARARRVVYHDGGLVMYVDGSYGYGPLLIRYDLDGNLEWVSDFTGEYESSTDWGGSMCLTPGGGGYTFASEYYSWIVGADWSGEEQWSQEIYGDMGRIGLSINPTMDGGYIFSGTGSHWSPPQTVDIHSAPADTGSTWDGWLVKMDPLGNHEWHVFNSIGTRDNYFNCVQQLSQGGYIVAGQIWDTTGVGSWNGYLLRFAPETGIEGGGSSRSGLVLHPSSNPFSSSVTITCSGEPLPEELLVYDLSGRRVRSLASLGSSFTWNGQDASGRQVPVGTYLIQGALEGEVSSVLVVRL
jgi:hypothetical protein